MLVAAGTALHGAHQRKVRMMKQMNFLLPLNK